MRPTFIVSRTKVNNYILGDHFCTVEDVLKRAIYKVMIVLLFLLYVI